MRLGTKVELREMWGGSTVTEARTDGRKVKVVQRSKGVSMTVIHG